MTKLEIINETVEYYKTHSRGLDDEGNCAYYADGNMCAVGRCLTEPEKFESDTRGVSLCDLNDESGTLEKALKPEYQGHKPLFWEHLQYFHDGYEFWVPNSIGGNNLTDKGLKLLEQLKIKWS